MKRKVLYFAIVFLAIHVCVSPIKLQAAPPYYEGKRIRIVTGGGPGGGLDRMARIFATYLPKYIPGKPTIIVENMVGAGNIIAANYIYNLAKPDGLTIGMVQRGLPFAQLLKVDGVKFDFTKYAWIGSPAVETSVLTVRSDTPYKSVEDLKKAKSPIKMGAAGVSSSATQFCELLRSFTGINILSVQYSTSPEVALAIERKEVDGKATSYSSFRANIEKGFYRPLIRGRVSEPGIENLPVDEDLTTSPIGKKLMAMRSGPDRIGRPTMAPPKTPDDIMKILRDAFAKATKDPEVLAMADKLELGIEHVPPEECLKVYSEILNQPEDIVKEFAKYIKF